MVATAKRPTNVFMSDEGVKCDALTVRIVALEKMLDEREERTKERFTTMNSSVSTAMTAAEKAVIKAEQATERRFEGVNEFRETLRDQAATLMPRAEYSVQHAALQDFVNQIAERTNALENTQRGKKEGLSLVGQIILAAITGAAAIGAVLIAFLRHI